MNMNIYPCSVPHAPASVPGFIPFLRNGRIVALAAVLCAFLPGFAAAQGAGTIEGRVFEAHEGSALANARVILEGTGAEAVTDESGTFRFSGVRPGEGAYARTVGRPQTSNIIPGTTITAPDVANPRGS